MVAMKEATSAFTWCGGRGEEREGGREGGDDEDLHVCVNARPDDPLLSLLHYRLSQFLRTSAICNSLAAAWMACGGIRPVGPRGAALAAAGARLPFLLAADGGMEAVVAMEPRLALLAMAARAAPLPPPFFIACVLVLPAVWGV